METFFYQKGSLTSIGYLEGIRYLIQRNLDYRI